MAVHNDLGNIGEDIAVNFLKKANYIILNRNWRYQKAEIDIIAKHNNNLIIVEVKTRSNNYFTNPEDAINAKKIKLLALAAEAYLLKMNLDLEIQFDVISIIKNKTITEIKHMQNAFHFF